MLLHKLLLLNLKLILLDVHNHGKQLIFKTTFSHNEVDNGTLGSDFRTEVRVREFGHEEQFELRIIVNNFSSQFKGVATGLLGDSTSKKWVKSGFNFFLDTFVLSKG